MALCKLLIAMADSYSLRDWPCYMHLFSFALKSTSGKGFQPCRLLALDVERLSDLTGLPLQIGDVFFAFICSSYRNWFIETKKVICFIKRKGLWLSRTDLLDVLSKSIPHSKELKAAERNPAWMQAAWCTWGPSSLAIQ